MLEVTGATAPSIHEALPIDDPKQRRPDITLARELLDWTPEVALSDGLRLTIEQSRPERLLGDQAG